MQKVALVFEKFRDFFLNLILKLLSTVLLKISPRLLLCVFKIRKIAVLPCDHFARVQFSNLLIVSCQILKKK